MGQPRLRVGKPGGGARQSLTGAHKAAATGASTAGCVPIVDLFPLDPI